MKKIALLFVLVITLLFGATMPALAVGSDQEVAEKLPYNDIGGTWFEKSALAYGYEDIFSDGSGSFYPDKEITRMEFARMLHKALEIKIAYFAATDIKEFYNDVESKAPGASELYDLVSTGIIDIKGSFGPNDKLNREDMIHFLIKGLDYVTGGDYAMIKIMPPPFADDDKISAELKNDVVKAVILKLINGSDNNMLLPKNGATRAEAVTVADRLVNLINTLTRKVAVTATYKEDNGSLTLSLSVANKSGETIKINHTSSQKFDFKLFDLKGDILYTWSADKFFSMALTSTEIKNGETADYSIVLDSATFSPIKSKTAYAKAYITGTSEDFSISTDGYRANCI